MNGEKSLREWAADYASAGLLIFPVHPNDKTPLVSQHGATTDAAMLEMWWVRWPEALIGCRAGPNELLLDIDPRHGGDRTWEALDEHFGPIRVGRMHFSGRCDGGFHGWFPRPEWMKRLSTKALDNWAQEHEVGEPITENGVTVRWTSGIDILQHDHRYTILPPSPHPTTGKPYYWPEAGNGELVELPEALARLLVRPEPAEQPTLRPVDKDGSVPLDELTHGDSIADWVSVTMTWGQILRPHGWTLIEDRGEDGSGDGSLWRHPSATAPHSASIRYGTLFVYSPNTHFEVTSPDDKHGYTKFRAWAVLEHGGDLSAAALAARGIKSGAPSSLDVCSPGELNRRTLTLTWVASVGIRRVQWLWDGRVPLGALTLLGGREGIGKSILAVELAARITRGALEGELHGQPRAVVIAATEDSFKHTIVPRLKVAGADLALVLRTDVTEADGKAGRLVLPHDIPGLAQLVAQRRAAAVVLDPLISRLDAALDTYRDAEVRRGLEPLVEAADKGDFSILGLIHVNKGTSGDPLTMLMASRAFVAVARSVLFTTLDAEQPGMRLLGVPKNNLGRTDMPTLMFDIVEKFAGPDVVDGTKVMSGALRWCGESERTIHDAIHDATRSPDARVAGKEAEDWLREYLNANPVADSKDVKEAASDEGHSERTLHRARTKIGAGVTRIGMPGRTVWSKPGLKPDEVDGIVASRAKSEEAGEPLSASVQLRLSDATPSRGE